MSTFDELSSTVQRLSAATAPAVVSIGRHGRGTGFVVAPGKVLTNAHNLRDRTTSVRFADGRTVQASVAGSNTSADLVVLDVDTADLEPLSWSDAEPSLGEVVFAVSAGRGQLRTTWGQVSAVRQSFPGPRGRTVSGAFEHTAPAAAGSSGAPVLDAQGRVIGINTHRPQQGFYLAELADADLRASVAEMAGGRVYEPLTLGVALMPGEVAARLRQAVGLPDRAGLLVRAVVPGSPAEAAGIRAGDLLVRAGETSLVSHRELFAVLAGLAPDAELPIALVRGSEELTVTVAFGAPADQGPQDAPVDAE